MAAKEKSKETVTKKKATKAKAKTIDVSEPTAAVHVTLGASFNMGNYESQKIVVGLTLPCRPTQVEVNQTFKKVYAKTKLEMARAAKDLVRR